MRRVAWCCWLGVGCGVFGGESSEAPEACADGIDNDRDLRWDGDDPDCVGIVDPPDEDPEDPEDPEDTDETCSTSSLRIDEVAVACTANDGFVNITVEVAGFVSGGDLFLSDTVNDPAWGENHPVAIDAEDECGTSLRTHLATDAGLDFVSGSSTLWGCSDFFENDAMTYAVRVADAFGEVCVAWGQDPSGLVRGEYDGTMVNSPEFSLAGCEVLP